ncbi:hypothetical protein EVAR_5143_1 [Eumeta japonica]|uniref:Uncharacterized protein n=1 Tax=Eumeta variegata TaxID=151549 RepID=A0A4C1SVB8_EUMVA|nr:hypothetical protein EVAR_5143_1 [Eumeta japonica]
MTLDAVSDVKVADGIIIYRSNVTCANSPTINQVCLDSSERNGYLNDCSFFGKVVLENKKIWILAERCVMESIREFAAPFHCAFRCARTPSDGRAQLTLSRAQPVSRRRWHSTPVRLTADISPSSCLLLASRPRPAYHYALPPPRRAPLAVRSRSRRCTMSRCIASQ